MKKTTQQTTHQTSVAICATQNIAGKISKLFFLSLDKYALLFSLVYPFCNVLNTLFIASDSLL